MIEQDGDFGAFVVNCDECPDSIEITEEDWHAMMRSLRAEGWRTFKDGEGGWAHVCPACVEQWRDGRDA